VIAGNFPGEKFRSGSVGFGKRRCFSAANMFNELKSVVLFLPNLKTGGFSGFSLSHEHYSILPVFSVLA
jgi:hypothetical protein